MLLVGFNNCSLLCYAIGGLAQIFDAYLYDCYLYVYYNMVSSIYMRLLGVCVYVIMSICYCCKCH